MLVRRGLAAAAWPAAALPAFPAKRGCATAAGASAAAHAAAHAQADLEALEHSAFLRYCRTAGIDVAGCAPMAPCSASRLMRCAAAPPQSAEALAALHGGRGLVAAEDLGDGATVLCAPIPSATISAPALAALQHARDPAAAAAVPATAAVAEVLAESNVRQPFYTLQLALAMRVAAERMALDSPHAPYFDSLPVPAVDDDRVLALHAGLLDRFEANEFNAHRRDFGVMLQRLHKRWLDAAAAAPPAAAPPASEAAVRASHRAVPPLAVLHWAWRTVLGRQHPLPLEQAPTATVHRGADAFKAVHFVQWFRLTGREAELVPVLAPHVDLVGHAPLANCQLEVSMLPLGTTCADINEALVAYREQEAERRAARSRGESHRGTTMGVKLPPWLEGLFPMATDGGGEGGANTIGDLRRRAEEEERHARVEEAIQAATARRRRAEPSVGSVAAGPVVRVPHVQVTTLNAVRAGEQLTYRFADAGTRAFALYRFGFVPITRGGAK